MNKPRICFTIFIKSKPKIVEALRYFHVVEGLNQRPLPSSFTDSRHIDRSLFFTNLPNERRQRKVKQSKGPIPYGNLIIECKNKALNHYSGMQYGKFEVVPLASKGWYHRKSYGDYFTIMPSALHPAFLTKENLPDTFEENGISEKVIQQLAKINVTHPTTIQAKAISKLLQGHNVFISGECGSGKTLAYVIALIENVLKWKNKISETYNAPLGIILLPTRELAVQVGVLASMIGSDLGVKCQSLIGGDIKSLIKTPELAPVDILTCTLRVLQKHLNTRLFTTQFCKHVIFDESDTFMDESFIKEIKAFIFKSNLNFTGLASPEITKNSAQVCFVSATVPPQLEYSLYEVIKGNKMEHVTTSYLHKPFSYALQVFKRISKLDKPEELLKIIKKNNKAIIPTMIFCNKTTTSYWLSSFLKENNIECTLISQQVYAADRLRNHRDFEAGIINVTVCTDVASRGLDFKKVKHVINYEFPTFMNDYIHRCGRTGRISQGNDCVVTSFISGKHELFLLQKIEMAVRTNSTLPNIYERKKLRKKENVCTV